MSPEDVKALRTRLRATTKDLSHALGIEPGVLTDWERGEQFPTKQFVDRLLALDLAGPDALPRAPGKRGGGKKQDPIAALTDPSVWMLLRKILVYPELRAAVTKLADAYEDPKGP